MKNWEHSVFLQANSKNHKNVQANHQLPESSSPKSPRFQTIQLPPATKQAYVALSHISWVHNLGRGYTGEVWSLK